MRARAGSMTPAGGGGAESGAGAFAAAVVGHGHGTIAGRSRGVVPDAVVGDATARVVVSVALGATLTTLTAVRGGAARAHAIPTTTPSANADVRPVECASTRMRTSAAIVEY